MHTLKVTKNEDMEIQDDDDDDDEKNNQEWGSNA